MPLCVSATVSVKNIISVIFRFCNFLYFLKLCTVSICSFAIIVETNGYMTFHPMQFQPMQIKPLPFQPLTISTYCIFNRPQFRPN